MKEFSGLNIIPVVLLKEYEEQFGTVITEAVKELGNKKSDLTPDSFSFYSSVASVFSSKIEKEDIELDSYLKHKFLSVGYTADYTKKPDDLFEAYVYASQNRLTEETLFQSHKILSTHLMKEQFRGAIRKGLMYVLDNDGRIEYVAAEASVVETEMNKFFADLKTLSQMKMSVPRAVYFASMLHLVFLKIHPFADGNGRTSRLLEKWFLAEVIGKEYWNLESEKFYYENLTEYYRSIRVCGAEYTDLDYSKAGPFLKMLVNSIK
ncbi:MAG: Fic family protein [Chitinophagaceae bacterium]